MSCRRIGDRTFCYERALMNIILWTVTLSALLLETYMLGRRYAIRYYDSVPITASGLILTLYVLGFFKVMNFIWIPASALLIFNVIRLVKTGRDKDTKKLPGHINEDLIMTVFFLILCTIVSLMSSAHVVKWWDDLNFWATDAKALYFFNGFTGRYGNVAPEFGDYPPAIQIAKWCTLKLSAGYNEGLAFCGYYLLNMILLLPLMRAADAITKRKLPSGIMASLTAGIPIKAIWMIVIMLIPGIFNDVWSFGSCSDVTMGIAYGAMLLSIFESIIPDPASDASDHTRLKTFTYIKTALYGSITILCKNTGFMWVAFASVLFIILTVSTHSRSKDDASSRKSDIAKMLASLVFIWVLQASWWIYCISHRRLAKLTGALARNATGGNITLPDDAATKLKVYIGGFVYEPMHTSHTPVLDLSAMWMFMILLVVMIFIFLTLVVNGAKRGVSPSQNVISRASVLILLLYTFITGIIIYSVILYSHLSLFATETQYGSTDVMAISISRYGAPFTIGTFMLSITVLTYVLAELNGSEGGKSLLPYITFAGICLFILLTTDYPAYSYMLKGYRADIADDIQSRNDMIDPEGRRFLEYIDNMQTNGYSEESNDISYDDIINHRVLFFRDDSQIHWVKNTYINYEVSPVAVVYSDYNKDMSSDEIDTAIDTLHADYIYRDGYGIEKADKYSMP